MATRSRCGSAARTVPDLSATPPRLVASRDGTPIAVFGSGTGPSIVLVHGAAADHTTWRVVGPRLADRYAVWAMDRRGRGASADGRNYDVEREFEDVAEVATALAAASGDTVPVVGHSFGGRVALGAARGDAISRLVVYEGAPAPVTARYGRNGTADRLARLADEGLNEELLETFLREVVGMPEPDLAAYRSNPVWPDRVAAAPTIVREIRAEASPAAGLDALAGVTVPVLQLLGSESADVFHRSTHALDERLANGRIAVIDGARHAAHHTHPDVFVELVTAFLDER